MFGKGEYYGLSRFLGTEIICARNGCDAAAGGEWKRCGY